MTEWLPSSSQKEEARKIGLCFTVRNATSDYQDYTYCMAWCRKNNSPAEPLLGRCVESWIEACAWAEEQGLI